MMTDTQTPDIEAAIEMVRRAATACRNLQAQAQPKAVEWFDWVPRHLDQLADTMEARDEA